METRKGVYRMYALYKSYPMWGRDWWCPDVPYAMFFHHEFAIHGAYWHNDFGTPVSHGCVNMAEMDAAEVFAKVKKGTVVWVH
jgi:lipoprotein-anchoring transpeptidase ErfK/SrfK